jgi:hypothetical protein
MKQIISKKALSYRNLLTKKIYLFKNPEGNENPSCCALTNMFCKKL